jgi:hypothetical protein
MLEACYTYLGQSTCDAIAGALVLVLIVALLLVAGAAVLLLLAARQMRGIDIPEDAEFFETLRLIPITIPLALDMLDLVFDIFAAPIAWIILDALGLHALRLVTVTEGLIPGTQAIPTMTAAWILARLTKPSRPSEVELRAREMEYELEARVQRRGARREAREWSEPDAGSDYLDYPDR